MKKSVTILKWIPRILCILAILFVSTFAVDVFSSERPFWENVAGFLIHLIPSFILITILMIAWKWEMLGGMILIITGLIFGMWVFRINYLNRHFSLGQSIINVSILCLPLIIAGVLFIISYNHRKKTAKSH